MVAKAKVGHQAEWIKAGKRSLLVRSDAHREFAGELREVSATLQKLSQAGLSFVQALKLTRAVAEDTNAMAQQFARRAGQAMGRPTKEWAHLRGVSSADLRWLSSEYLTFAEELLWLIRRALQVEGQGHEADHRTLLKPTYRLGFGLSDVSIVEHVRLRAEQRSPASGVDLLALTLDELAHRHEAVSAHAQQLANAIPRGAPKKNAAMSHQQKARHARSLTGLRLVKAILEVHDRDRSARLKIPGALYILANEIELASGRWSDGALYAYSFEAAVKKRVRSLSKELSRWRCKQPTYKENRARAPQASAKTSDGFALQTHWGSTEATAQRQRGDDTN
jgi:hypothetical protein